MDERNGIKMKTNCDMQNAERGTPSSTLSPRGLRLGRASGSERGGRDWWEIRNVQSGFTIIEIILVMMITAILAAVAIPRFDFGTSSKASVDGAAYMIASDIRYAQEFAMANRISKSISFSTAPPANKYTFSPVSIGMDPSGQLSGATIGTTIQFTFNSLGEPTTSSPGVWAVTVSAGGVTRTITVLQYTGKVNIS